MEIRARKTERKLEAWLGSLVYHSAQGKADAVDFGQRLRGIIASIVPPEAVREVARQALTQIPSPKAMPDLKGRIVEGCTPERMAHRIGLMRDMFSWCPLLKEGDKPQTVGDFVKGWAELTGRDGGEFERRLYPRLALLVATWQDKTACLGLEDEAVFQHQQEAADFMAGLVNLLIAETPPANLGHAIKSAMQAIVDTPIAGLEKGFHDLFGDASQFTAWEASRQVGAAFESDPGVKMALLAPEVAALVEFEEQKQGWGGDADRAVELLEGSVVSELQETIKGRHVKTVLLNSLKLAGRRSLLHNLKDAMRGQLKGRLVAIALRWLKKGGAQVVTHWEFPTSPMAKENANGIRRWLFRRGVNNGSNEGSP
jgi:hypothetical protein